MRFREITFYNFRGFRGRHQISLVDTTTDVVRQLSVLAGSNGTGKTTILEAIEALVNLFAKATTNMLQEILASDGFVSVIIEYSDAEIDILNVSTTTHQESKPHLVYVFAGQRSFAPSRITDKSSHFIACFSDNTASLNGTAIPQSTSLNIISNISTRVPQNVYRNAAAEAPNSLYGGLIYFPYNRLLGDTQAGAIELPLKKFPWVYRYSKSQSWQGTLEQLWVWQNYLDLEQGTIGDDSTRLYPFVETVENVLGSKRKIIIRNGRVLVPAPWQNGHDSGVDVRYVRLDQLPSGEQQVLLLFGELARLLRPGVIIVIDEIENSLHPTLQRLIIANLARIAREWDAQVILTTHSIDVINTVRGNSLILLDDLMDNRESSVAAASGS